MRKIAKAITGLVLLPEWMRLVLQRQQEIRT
jgi:hypothetical protein